MSIRSDLLIVTLITSTDFHFELKALPGAYRDVHLLTFSTLQICHPLSLPQLTFSLSFMATYSYPEDHPQATAGELSRYSDQQDYASPSSTFTSAQNPQRQYYEDHYEATTTDVHQQLDSNHFNQGSQAYFTFESSLANALQPERPSGSSQPPPLSMQLHPQSRHPGGSVNRIFAQGTSLRIVADTSPSSQADLTYLRPSPQSMPPPQFSQSVSLRIVHRIHLLS